MPTHSVMLVVIGILYVIGHDAKLKDDASFQPPGSSAVMCDLHAIRPPSYLDCALYFDRGGRLRRGIAGEEIARGRGFSPVPLTELVRGDSAMHYAVKYQDFTWTASAFQFLALASVGIGTRVGHAPGCTWPPCALYRTRKSRTFGVIGLSLGILSLPFSSEAGRAGTKALWWHNAWLSR